MPPSESQLWDLLQRESSSRTRPEPKNLASFENGIVDVGQEEDSTTVNRYDLLCPRSGCGSIILKKGAGKLVERESIVMEPSDLPSNPLLPKLPASPELSHWWLVTPTPMQFENIGFSRPVESVPLGPSGKKLKLLACAECDLGPLGWSEEGGTEFWVASTRVGYRSQ